MSKTRRALILAACSGALFLAGLDVGVVSPALPQLGRSLHAGMAGLAWVADAYTLTLAAFLILAGSLADRLGRKRVFLAGLSVFTAGSIACSLAPGLAWLAGFRALQALGAAACNPVSMAIIRDVWRDRVPRARATGVWTAAFGAGLAAGPSAGGFLTAALGWRSVFWVTVPVALAAIVLTACFVPESRDPSARPDIAAQALIAAGMAGLVYAVITAPSAGWESPRVLAALSACAAAAVLLALRRHPAAGTRLVSRPYAGSALVAFAAFASLNAGLFLTTLDLQDGRGFQPSAVAACVLPAAVLTILLAPLAGRLTATWGPVPLMAAGGVLTAAGGMLLGRLEASSVLGWVIVSFAVLGAGYGLVNAPATIVAVAAGPERAGAAAGGISAARHFGAAAGVAVATSLTASALHGSHAGTALAGAERAGFAVVAVCGLLIVAGAVLAGRRHPETVADAPGASLVSSA